MTDEQMFQYIVEHRLNVSWIINRDAVHVDDDTISIRQDGSPAALALLSAAILKHDAARRAIAPGGKTDM